MMYNSIVFCDGKYDAIDILNMNKIYLNKANSNMIIATIRILEFDHAFVF